MKKFELFIITLIIVFAVQAQSPVGKWKFTAVYTETFAGKKTDLLKDYTNSDPCFTKITFILTSDGKFDAQGNGCKMGPSAEKIAYWKTAGKTIKFYAGKDDTEPEIFDLEITGNKMRWIRRFDYESDIDRSVGIKLVVEELTRQ
jgi:hypothetical protein